jgi:phosphoenolpyruvate carboxylase
MKDNIIKLNNLKKNDSNINQEKERRISEIQQEILKKVINIIPLLEELESLGEQNTLIVSTYGFILKKEGDKDET